MEVKHNHKVAILNRCLVTVFDATVSEVFIFDDEASAQALHARTDLSNTGMCGSIACSLTSHPSISTEP